MRNTTGFPTIPHLIKPLKSVLTLTNFDAYVFIGYIEI